MLKFRLFILSALFTFLFSELLGQDTFSICAVDPITGEVGSAGASCIAGSRIISDVHPGIGVIHTQSWYLGGNQNYGNSLMAMRLSPQQIIDSLVANDVGGNASLRQYGVVDLLLATPRTAAFTGLNCMNYKDHITGTTYSIQGNILAGQHILDSMEARFNRSNGSLACKLMAALQGANVPGADTRCLSSGTSSLSAFIRVAKPGDTGSNLFLDLNINNAPSGTEPIDQLQILFDGSQSCVTHIDKVDVAENIRVFPNPANDLVSIDAGRDLGKVLIQLYNSIGELVYEAPGSGSIFTIERGNLPAGIYFFKIGAGEEMFSGTFRFR